ncbi:MAG: efflux RND transporter periplasmic adaptor subunit [Lachnospiraceae bacterium]|nr:efflux RND transporter periplasmic adaptor subunit [Lachnospiraceae bacterium]
MYKSEKIKRMAAFGTACVLSAVFLFGCGETKEEEVTEEQTIIDVSVQTPEVKNISTSANFSATVVAESEVKVIPLVGGEVVEKNFEVGDHVNAGDLLFKIDDEAYQIALKQAEATVTTAQAGLTTAQATLNQSEANANTTRAQAIQNVGEIPYNEQKKNYGVDSAYVDKRKSNNALKDAEDNVDLAKHNLNDYKDARDAAESAMKTAKAAYEAAPEEPADVKEELKEAYELAKKTYETADSKVDSAENAYDSAKRTADNAEMSYALNGEAYSLAQMERDNYNTYSKATTIYGAYASAVGADTSVTTSKAGVTSSAASVKSAKAGLESAQLNLDHTSVEAPVSGTITAIDVSLHNMASTQSAAYTIQSDEPCKVVFYVAEETARNILPGSDAIVTKNGVDYDAKITSVYDTIDNSTGLFKVEASVTGQGSSDLIAGSSVSIKTITRRADNVITVPIDSVYYEGDMPFVYVEEAGKAKKVYVTTGLSDDRSIEIADGIKASDKVVVTWNGSLRDGSELNTAGSSGGMEPVNTTETEESMESAGIDSSAGAGDIE